MKITIAMPSKSTDDPLLVEGINYLSRLRSPLSCTTLFLKPKNHAKNSLKEKRVALLSLELLKRTEGQFRIALSESGSQFSSIQWTSFLKKHMFSTPKIAFLIGDAFGLSNDAIKNCAATLSLSSMTLPHRMAFLILCEQLYRAGEIIANTPYHK
jgi:23S rRNA (pseudouridine1915-N3)-methyltransferase